MLQKYYILPFDQSEINSFPLYVVRHALLDTNFPFSPLFPPIEVLKATFLLKWQAVEVSINYEVITVCGWLVFWDATTP